MTEEAFACVLPLRVALAAHRASGRPADLDRAFAVARSLIAALPGGDDGQAPDLEQVRWLAVVVPEFDELLSIAASEAEGALAGALADLWSALELPPPPPGWTPAEREAARMLLACACAGPAAAAMPDRVPTGLRGLAAGRLAARLSGELAASEELWLRALGARYDSVRHRYARRTAWRSRGLSELMHVDDEARRAVTARLARWLTAGAHLRTLTAELEAALVHVCTPPKFA